MRICLGICLALVTVACGGTGVEEGVSADQIGLSKVGVTEVPDPPTVTDNTTYPGERTPTPAANSEAPPVVSHGIADFLPIALGENMCIDCHAVEEKVAGEPTPIPESHYVDLRNRPGVVGSEIAGARYVCTSCHVATTDAEPLVANTFGG